MKEKASTSTNDTQVLKTVLFKYLQLHEELQSQSSELTQQIKQQTKENKQLIHVFKENLEELGNLEENLSEYSQEMAIKALQRLSNQLKAELDEKIEYQFGRYVVDLLKQTGELKKLVDLADYVLHRGYWQERIITTMIAMLSSMLSCWIVMPPLLHR
jgi:seryl-tRNA synthetase